MFKFFKFGSNSNNFSNFGTFEERRLDSIKIFGGSCVYLKWHNSKAKQNNARSFHSQGNRTKTFFLYLIFHSKQNTILVLLPVFHILSSHKKTVIKYNKHELKNVVFVSFLYEIGVYHQISEYIIPLYEGGTTTTFASFYFAVWNFC